LDYSIEDCSSEEVPFGLILLAAVRFIHTARRFAAMKNVIIKTEKKKVTIEFDPTKEFGESKSGKSITIATTEGNHKVTVDGVGEIVIGLNSYKPKK
jgi:hypothetical protein